MKMTSAVLVLAAFALCVSPAALASRELLQASTWLASLSGGEEVAGPAGTGPFSPAATFTGATGECKLTISAAEDSVAYTCLVRGPLATSTQAFGVVDSPPKERAIIFAHIHLGARQTNGPISVFLLGKPPVKIFQEQLPYTFSGTFTQASLEPGFQLSNVISAIKSEAAYVNVHSVIYPGGELRGQIVRF